VRTGAERAIAEARASARAAPDALPRALMPGTPMPPAKKRRPAKA
jgi:hypothetical protein